ncbi:ADP,ATP carrier protein [Arachis hypogaea]|nr:ADP,ATP carrier protein [Arachis hypogaea]
MVKSSQYERFSKDFVMGGVAAIILKSAAAPIKRVKLLLQNQAEMIKSGQLKKPYMGFQFCIQRLLQKHFWAIQRERRDIKWFAGNVASGSAAGATTSLLLYHLDCARTRLGTDALECRATSQRQFKGLVDVYRKTLLSDGVVGLYRGFGVSIVGITMYQGMYFGIYDTVKPIISVGPSEGNFFASFFLGWSITTSAGVCAYLFDTLRRRMMLTSGNQARAGVLAGYDQLNLFSSRH